MIKGIFIFFLLLSSNVLLSQTTPDSSQQGIYVSPKDDELALEIYRQVEEVQWKVGKSRDGATTFWAEPIDPSPENAYLRRSFLKNVDLDDVLKAHYLENASFLAFINKDNFEKAEVLNVLHQGEDTYHAIVRTFYRLPMMRNREYVHHLYLKKLDEHTYIFSCRQADEEEIPPVSKGYVRATMYPSGQLIRRLEDGRIQLDHLMSTTLNGWFKPSFTNIFLKKAQVRIYLEEAILAKEYFEKLKNGN
ncbi:MAG: START domain-containing protein [Bacteroidia bacterium]|nr:START domain-containing protein [Bacteroidia bacterium]